MSETLQLEQLTESLQQLLGESLFAIYLYGSAVDGGLGPESDLDVLVVVNQALTLHQRGVVSGNGKYSTLRFFNCAQWPKFSTTYLGFASP